MPARKKPELSDAELLQIAPAEPLRILTAHRGAVLATDATREELLAALNTLSVSVQMMETERFNMIANLSRTLDKLGPAGVKFRQDAVRDALKRYQTHEQQ